MSTYKGVEVACLFVTPRSGFTGWLETFDVDLHSDKNYDKTTVTRKHPRPQGLGNDPISTARTLVDA